MPVGIAVQFEDGCFSGTDGRIQEDAIIQAIQIFPSVF